MSRDWTPREEWLVEQHSIREGRGDVWDFLASLKWTPAGGEPVRVVSDEEIALRKGFPVLGKFLECFVKLYHRLSIYENGIEFLQKKDAELARYIEENGSHNTNDYLIRWFEGELVDNFHYREPNNALVMERLCEDAMERTGKQYRDYVAYRQNWYTEHGVCDEMIAYMKDEYLDDVEGYRFEGSFYQYEMEFGYEGVGAYDSFDVFLKKQRDMKDRDVDRLIANALAESREQAGNCNKKQQDIAKE